ncbi:MAG: centromere/microtubule-binding protein cbf5 [Alyxoria varia]|nr:MAG: centromere/microtubule-binding protein cbf5 [Alyxoria varia]
MDAFYAAPPIIRTFTAGVVATSCIVYGYPPAFRYVFFDWYRSFLRLPPEIWRPFTSFLVSGAKLQMILDPYFLYMYGSQLERSPRFSRTGDFFWYIVFNMLSIVALAGGLLGEIRFNEALTMAFIYTFSQDNANARVTFIVIQVEAKYLPLGSLALTLFMAGPLAALTSASGIVSAHLYDFLTRIWPAFGGGSNWIQTPAFISRLFGDDSRVPQPRPHGGDVPIRNKIPVDDLAMAQDPPTEGGLFVNGDPPPPQPQVNVFTGNEDYTPGNRGYVVPSVVKGTVVRAADAGPVTLKSTGTEYVRQANRGSDPNNRPIAELLDNGVILLDKPSNPSSHEVVSWVRKVIGCSKTGHSGTLDPKVTGILVVCLGKATRLVKAQQASGKEYVAVVQFHGTLALGRREFRAALKKLEGAIFQTPPEISAVKKELRVRTAYEITAIEYDEDKNIGIFKTKCQAGTYIRVICEHLGFITGVGAHMAELRRTRSGHADENSGEISTLHNLSEAMWQWKTFNDDTYLRSVVKPIEYLLVDYKRIVIKDTAVAAIGHGGLLTLAGVVKFEREIKIREEVVMVTEKGEAVCIAWALVAGSVIENMDHGSVAKIKRNLMERHTYGRVWGRGPHALEKKRLRQDGAIDPVGRPLPEALSYIKDKDERNKKWFETYSHIDGQGLKTVKWKKEGEKIIGEDIPMTGDLQGYKFYEEPSYHAPHRVKKAANGQYAANEKNRPRAEDGNDTDPPSKKNKANEGQSPGNKPTTDEGEPSTKKAKTTRNQE